MKNENYLTLSREPVFFFSSFSHKGLVRENNEDYLDTRSFTTNESRPRNVFLAVLADGVGGHQAGEVASRIGVETIISHIKNCENLDQPGTLLRDAVTAANTTIVKDAESNPHRAGMGSTCVCALIIDQALFIANLGDSRLYLKREEKIRQLTFDHTWLEEIAGRKLPGAGKITRNHPLAHVLKRYLGSKEPIKVDLRIRTESSHNTEMDDSRSMQLVTGDHLLLMSDGISDLLNNDDILEILQSAQPAKISKRLVYCALEKGGHDNASVISIII